MPFCPYAPMPLCPYALLPLCPHAPMPPCPHALMPLFIPLAKEIRFMLDLQYLVEIFQRRW